MSFSNLNTFIQYTANGVQDTFAINFHILENSTNIEAIVYDVTDPSSPTVDIIPYSIDHTNYPASEVVFTTPPAADRIVHITRKSIMEQSSNFEKGSFPAEAVEETFDKVTMMVQEHETKLSKALVNPDVGVQATIEEVQAAANFAAEAESRLDQHDLDIAANALAITTKEPIITAGTSSQYYRGDKTMAELNPAVIASLLTGFASNPGVILATDTILQAIQKLDGNILAKEDPWSVIVQAIAGTYALSHRSIHIAKSSNQTLNLPVPSSGVMCKVKMAGNYSGITVQSAAGIDGFGTSYTLQSDYEALTLVSDGIQWFIV